MGVSELVVEIRYDWGMVKRVLVEDEDIRQLIPRLVEGQPCISGVWNDWGLTKEDYKEIWRVRKEFNVSLDALSECFDLPVWVITKVLANISGLQLIDETKLEYLNRTLGRLTGKTREAEEWEWDNKTELGGGVRDGELLWEYLERVYGGESLDMIDKGGELTYEGIREQLGGYFTDKVLQELLEERAREKIKQIECIEIKEDDVDESR